MVGDKGLEPSTSRSQTARASQLRQSPKNNQQGYYILFDFFMPVKFCQSKLIYIEETDSNKTSIEYSIRFCRQELVGSDCIWSSFSNGN